MLSIPRPNILTIPISEGAAVGEFLKSIKETECNGSSNSHGKQLKRVTYLEDEIASSDEEDDIDLSYFDAEDKNERLSSTRISRISIIDDDIDDENHDSYCEDRGQLNAGFTCDKQVEDPWNNDCYESENNVRNGSEKVTSRLFEV